MIAVHQQVFNDLRLSIAGIIFLGAPLQGSDIAIFGKWLGRLVGLDTALLESLQKNCTNLHALSRDFWGSYSDYDLVCFYEKIGSDYGPLQSKVCLSVISPFCTPN